MRGRFQALTWNAQVVPRLAARGGRMQMQLQSPAACLVKTLGAHASQVTRPVEDIKHRTRRMWVTE